MKSVAANAFRLKKEEGRSAPQQAANPPAMVHDTDDDDFTPEQIAECRDLFSMFDKDGGGEIDHDEFAAMMKTLGLNLNERELEEFFDEMDVNGTGAIEFDELLRMLRRISRNISAQEELQEAFRFFVPDGSGAITNHELHRVLSSMGEDITVGEADEMIRSATGGRHAVDFNTFKQFCLGNPKNLDA